MRVSHPGELDIWGAFIPVYDPEIPLYLGGAVMLATADGYVDFLRMLLNHGTLNGQRFLETATVENIHAPHTQLDNPEGHNGFNLWVTGEPTRTRGEGEEGLWVGGGYEGTHFWVDPKREFVGVINGTVDGLQIAFQSDSVGTGFNVASIFFVVSAWGSGIAGVSAEFVVYRVLGGMAVGAASVIAPAYIGEVAPAHYRGRLITLQQIAIITGLFSAFVSNYLLAGFAGASTEALWLGFDAWQPSSNWSGSMSSSTTARSCGRRWVSRKAMPC